MFLGSLRFSFLLKDLRTAAWLGNISLTMCKAAFSFEFIRKNKDQCNSKSVFFVARHFVSRKVAFFFNVALTRFFCYSLLTEIERCAFGPRFNEKKASVHFILLDICV